MRVIIFTWEFPPRTVGQLAHYVNKLAVELVKNGVDVYVVTFHDSLTGYHEGADGVKTYRVSNPLRPHISVLTWALSLNQEIAKAAADIYYSCKREINLIDVHDWHFIPAAVSLKKALNLPFTYSVDSIEEHRSHGANAPLNQAIKSIEWLGTYEAQKIVVKSSWMKSEVNRNYNVPSEKISFVSSNSQKWISQIMEAYEEASFRNEKNAPRVNA